MRRSVAISALCMSTAVVAGASLVAGCEDGPNQPYTPATGTLFNSGGSDGSADPGNTPIDGGYPGRTVLNICTDDLKRQRWAKMLTEDIVPPVGFAGIDLRGDKDTWRGLTVEEATKAPDQTTLEGGNCQGVADGIGGCGEQQQYFCGNIHWGDNAEVQFSYLQSLHIIDQLNLNLGYTGQMKANDSKGHKYVLELGLPITKDGVPLLVNWSASPATSDPALTDLFNAIMNQFAKDVGINWGGDVPSCTNAGLCLNTGSNGGDGIFGVRPMGFYMQFHSLIPNPGASVPYNIYVDYIKTTPSSSIPMVLNLGVNGPFSYSNTTPGYGLLNPDAGGTAPVCQQQIGMSYGDYIKNCVAPYPDSDPVGAQLNTVNKAKLIGARTHDFENINFDVVGINGDFTHTPELKPTDIVQDTDVPADTDQLTDWFFDVRAYGGVKNDSNAHASGAGTGLVVREFQRLVSLDLARLVGKLPMPPGSCTGANPQPTDANHVCTGMETMTIPGVVKDPMTGKATGPVVYPTDTVLAQTFFDQWPAYNAIFAGGYLGSVLKPRDHYALYCLDPSNVQAWVFANVGAGDCAYAAWWFASYQWVTRVMGHGNVNSLPLNARDRRYYYYWFGVAMTKYLKAYGALLDAGKDATDTTLLTPDVVAAQPIDLETLFFDNEQGGTFDYFEYIDLASVNPNPPKGQEFMKVPLDYSYGNDVLGGNQRYTNYYRRLDREENALYTALAENKALPPAVNANHGVNLTNMFGSPVLVNAPTNNPNFPTSYQCNIEMWAATSPQQAPAGACTLDPVKATWSCPLCNAITPNVLYSCPLNLPDYGGGPKCDGTTGTAGPCCGSPPPTLDANGNTLMDKNGQAVAWDPQSHYGAAVDGKAHPWLWQYPGVWGSTIFNMGHSPIQVQSTDRNLESANVVVPNFASPWAACATKQTDAMGNSTCDPRDPKFATPIGPFIMPWNPPELGAGFTIPMNGASDKNIRTAELAFEGQLETYTVDYLPFTDPLQPSCQFNGTTLGGGTCEQGFSCVNKACIASDNSIRILAIESHDFLGQVFPCQDQETGDILAVGMYEPAATILNWIANHPGVPLNGVPSASDNCNIVVRYSAFNNYPDFITSLANGVKISINPGQGLGRVVDATLFDPIVETY